MTEDITRQVFPNWLPPLPILNPAEHVRHVPAMYIEAPDEYGLLCMVRDAFLSLANVYVFRSFSNISATLHEDLSFSICLSGLGSVHTFANNMVPVTLNELTECVRPTGHRTDYQFGHGYESLAVANLLSESMVLVTVQDKVESLYRWERGKYVSDRELPDLARIDDLQVHFLPDTQIFGDVRMSSEIAKKLFETDIPLLRPETFCLHDFSGHETHSTSQPSEGVATLTSMYATGRSIIGEPVKHFRIVKDDNGDYFELDFAIQFHDEPGHNIISFANMRATKRGGTHAQGLHTGLKNALGAIKYFGSGDKYLRSAPGFTAVIAVRLRQPLIGGPTRGVLHDDEVREPIASIVRANIEERLKDDRSLRTQLTFW